MRQAQFAATQISYPSPKSADLLKGAWAALAWGKLPSGRQ
jgi:hypothetical protein